MPNYAFIKNNIVTNIAIFDNFNEEIKNAFIATHQLDDIVLVDKNTQTGGSYDGIQFIPVQPYPSWIWDNQAKEWVAPTPKPNDNLIYGWNEDNKEWYDVISNL
jgi:hypothetical protein